ncbi:MAG: sterol desaturase family protein [Bacteriovorax sp.]|nr:sterol desaturase family protein [Bacteriovorax sp.]
MGSLKLFFFMFIPIVELLTPDRTTIKQKLLLNWKNIHLKQFLTYRYICNCALGFCWIFFINFFGNDLLGFYNQIHFRTFGYSHFRSLDFSNSILFFLIFDYSTYLWHRANHYFKFLKNFHQVHHSDLEVDTSTTFRFHFLELLFQLCFKVILAFIFRIHFFYFFFFESLLLLFGYFHHANIYLPKKLTTLISLVLVTPRYHFNHHLLDLKYANSNYSSILTVWDRLHGTYTAPVVEDNPALGIKNRRSISELGLWQLLKMPFNL